jgi:hypothetical protein
MRDERMRCYLVVVTERAGWSEAIDAIASTHAGAVKFAREIIGARPQEVVRCRVRRVDWTAGQVEDLWYEWGRRDARAGLPLTPLLPPEYAESYRRGFWAGTGWASA